MIGRKIFLKIIPKIWGKSVENMWNLLVKSFQCANKIYKSKMRYKIFGENCKLGKKISEMKMQRKTFGENFGKIMGNFRQFFKQFILNLSKLCVTFE